jgi:periplasmic protein TonB
MKKICLLLLLISTLKGFSQHKDSSKTSITQIDTSVYKNVEVEASFPGGEGAWNKYIQAKLEEKIDKLTKNKASVGTCVVLFIVNNDGSITNIEVQSLKKSLLAKILVDAIENGPKWIPAIQNGMKVKAYRRQKITFQAPE